MSRIRDDVPQRVKGMHSAVSGVKGVPLYKMTKLWNVVAEPWNWKYTLKKKVDNWSALNYIATLFL